MRLSVKTLDLALPKVFLHWKKKTTTNSHFGLNSGYLEFEATVSTSIDQIALTSGELIKQWTQDNRRYFHYKMATPIERYFAFFSGKYEVLKTNHKGVDVEVYFDPAHDMNVERIQLAMTDSIDYYGASFGPFQHKQAKVVEFAGPENFGQDFPNIIAYSERAGFIHDQRNPKDNDQVYWFVAHEMAHQWWGAQLNAANVQGGTMLVETLAQYSAFMLIKRKYGDERLRNMLKFELDRYLTGRGRDAAIELPLIRDENQPYLHYNKGSLAMMALVDTLGETRLNQSLSAFLNEFKFSTEVYPTTLDLLDFIRQDTNEKEQLVIKRLFEEVNLFEMSLTKADWVETEDGQFEVTFLIKAKRLMTDNNGKRAEAPLSAMMDIALFAQPSFEGTPIYLQKHLIVTGENTIVVKVAQKPAMASVDPDLHFIDADISNNAVSLK
jgi:ABC-2 type transport system permease protein